MPAVESPPTDEVIRVAEFRSTLRRFLRRSEHAARASGLTPQRHLLLVMIKGAPDGSERATISQLADRLQLAQSTVTELVGRAEEAGLWLLFVGTAARAELYAGMAAAAIAVPTIELTRRAGLLAFRPDFRRVLASWRLPFEIVADLGVVLVVLGRAVARTSSVRGSFIRIPTGMGRRGSRAAWRRAFAESAGTLGPNRIVVDIDSDGGEALVHALRARRPGVRRLP
jgi:multisubunit Na+/H+ antiporter MnhE subunit